MEILRSCPQTPVRDCGYKSVTISWVRRHAEPLAYGELAAAVESAGSRATASASPRADA